MRARVAYLTNIPTPYGSGFARELSRIHDLRVIFDAISEPNRHWSFSKDELDFPYVVARGLAVPYTRRRPHVPERRYLQLRYNLIPLLRYFAPDVVVSGEMGLCTVQAALFASTKKVPLIIRWEGTHRTEGNVDIVRRVTRRLLVRAATRFWTNGRQSTDLLQSFGVSRALIDEGMIGADTHFFQSATRELLPRREALRRDLGLRGVAWLFVGQYTARKGIQQLLNAMDILVRKQVPDWSAVFVGSGPLLDRLNVWREAHKLAVPVAIDSFVQPAGLPRYLAAADLFVLPTLEDNWSISSLEAAAAGLPQLVSVHNGAISDLLVEPSIGRAVDPLNVDELASRLGEYIRCPSSRIPNRVVDHIVEDRSPQRVAARAAESIARVLG